MNHEELLRLIDKVDQSSLAYFNYETADNRLTLAKEMPKNQEIQQNESKDLTQVETTIEERITSDNDILEMKETVQDEIIEGSAVTSPMVGVAYLRANPDSEPFIQVGDTVEEGDTILIIEAMKLMNEIQSTLSGTVTEILVDNESIVEFGQPLVRIK